MENFKWTRRRFLSSIAAWGTLPARFAKAAGILEATSQRGLPRPRSQKKSPEVITGRVIPLLKENVARPLRYRPENGGFVIRNGVQFFNRPLYGPNIPFRADGGDRPEFSLYLPGHGGNLRLGLIAEGKSNWLFDLAVVESRYIDGRLIYEFQDAMLGRSGTLRVEALTLGAALWVEVAATSARPGLELAWAYGGVSGRKGKRNGDIGCESEPITEFFQVRPEECAGNSWLLNTPSADAAEVQGGKIRLRVEMPQGAQVRLSDAERWYAGWETMWSSASPAPDLPVLLGRAPLASAPQYLRVSVLEGAELPPEQSAKPPAVNDAEAFARRQTELSAIAQRVYWKTPDNFLNGTGGAMGIAADALWDEKQGCLMHGAVAWRVPFPGWRGPYVLDVLGEHDRMRRNLRHWIARQNVSPATNGSGGRPTAKGFSGIAEATGEPDPGSHGARTEHLLHSAGDLIRSHYDMNLVFFDALLRHLRWTGDVAFARETWPALELHAAWERRLFRRDYGTEDKPLPLYEAYAAIWASDNLQYNGGGAAHTSAYNAFLNRRMAELARILKQPAEIAAAYDAEADAIEHAMRELLWMPQRGAFAESREWLAERRRAEDPAVWTMYHTIDCEVSNAKESWQMAADRLRALRKVPIIGEGVPEDAGWQIGCSDWQPYVWSLTLLVLAENLASALALYQAGMAEEGYELLRGSLLDAGYRGLCPGNFPMSLQLDPHRHESQRDFGDPIGCASRVLVEGLWGVQPDLLAGRLTLRPQFPADWNSAELHHPELELGYRREGLHETWKITPRFASPVEVMLELPARTVSLPAVHINGKDAEVRFLPDAVGRPKVFIVCPTDLPSVHIDIRWSGAEPVARSRAPIPCEPGKPVPWPKNIQTDQIDDPQGSLQDGVARRAGRYTVFALQSTGECRFWLPLELHVADAKPATQVHETQAVQYEPVRIDSLFTGRAREILTRGYSQPRSGLCSLNLPDGLLGGWANFNVTANIDDAGLRGCGGELKLPGGLRFLTPAGADALNCCYVSHWAQDKNELRIPLSGRAGRLALLLIGTTFPQATGAAHASVHVSYRGENSASTIEELRSPQQWWPVEQDYLVDDYLFRLDVGGEPEKPLPLRVDLLTAQARQLIRSELRGKGGPIEGGSAFVVQIELDSQRELSELMIRCELYGVVAGLLGVSLGR